MVFRMNSSKKGFTLVELMVVVALILVMATIIMAAVSQARQNTREKKRLSDLANIEFALTLYKEKNRSYPSFPIGIEAGAEENNILVGYIAQFNGNVYSDPLAAGGDGVYEYWYDSDFTCSEPGQTVIFARTMELSKNANFTSVCTDSGADTSVASANSYIEILKQ
jgi:prepilin-type N-terminal cleavage/methylation domain-containing protein